MTCTKICNQLTFLPRQPQPQRWLIGKTNLRSRLAGLLRLPPVQDPALGAGHQTVAPGRQQAWAAPQIPYVASAAAQPFAAAPPSATPGAAAQAGTWPSPPLISSPPPAPFSTELTDQASTWPQCPAHTAPRPAPFSSVLTTQASCQTQPCPQPPTALSSKRNHNTRSSLQHQCPSHQTPSPRNLPKWLTTSECRH